MMPSTPLIAIVDDDPAVLDSLENLLTSYNFQVSSYLSGKSFIESLSGEQPDCAIIDLQMPAMNGLEVLQNLSRIQVRFPTIVVTAFGDIPKAVEAMRSGAFDFIEKPVDVNRLIECINSALQSTVTQDLPTAQTENFQAAYKTLTPREMEVYSRMVLGEQNKIIARILGISHRTIEIHRAKVMKKMGVPNISQLIRMDVASGISDNRHK